MTLAGVTGDESRAESGEEVLGASKVRIRPWQYGVVALVLLVLGAVQVVRHSTNKTPGARRSLVTPTPLAPAPRIIEGQAAVIASVGSRCPTSVVCGVSLTVSSGMATAFGRDFPTATVSLLAQAFDAGAPRALVYWQQIGALMPDGTSVVLTEQRLLSGSHRSSRASVHGWPDGVTVTVTQTRSGWQVIANLYGTRSSTLPITTARHWVETVPIPVNRSR